MPTLTDDTLRRWQTALQTYLDQVQETAREIQEAARRLEIIAQQMKRGVK